MATFKTGKYVQPAKKMRVTPLGSNRLDSLLEAYDVVEEEITILENKLRDLKYNATQAKAKIMEELIECKMYDCFRVDMAKVKKIRSEVAR